MGEEKEIGEVTHYFTDINVGIVKLTGTLKKGDKVRFKGATTNFTQKIDSMEVDHEEVEVAKEGEEVGIKVNERVREGDKVQLNK